MTYSAPLGGRSPFSSHTCILFHSQAQSPCIKSCEYILITCTGVNDSGLYHILLNIVNSDEVPISEWVMHGIAMSSPAWEKKHDYSISTEWNALKRWGELSCTVSKRKQANKPKETTTPHRDRKREREEGPVHRWSVIYLRLPPPANHVCLSGWVL